MVKPPLEEVQLPHFSKIPLRNRSNCRTPHKSPPPNPELVKPEERNASISDCDVVEIEETAAGVINMNQQMDQLPGADSQSHSWVAPSNCAVMVPRELAPVLHWCFCSADVRSER